MNNASITVGIVGATGAVGQELLALLHDRKFPLASLRLFASARSVGKVVEYGGKKYTVEEAKLGAFAGVDVAFFAAGGSVTRALAPDAVKSGCLVIDKSSHYRMDPDVPLVIPEINPQGLRAHKGIDMPAPTGTPIRAAADGTVGKADWFGGYGLYVQLEHGAGLETRYGHMSRIAVAEGQAVHKGDVIGYVGSTGRSTGSHLHYEVRVAGEAVNPVPYMQAGTPAAPTQLASAN